MQSLQDKLEEFKECLYCGSKNIYHFISAPDRFSKRDDIFNASKCKECGLVFQNPRVKEEFIGEYYGEGDDLGYYRIPERKNKNFFSKLKDKINTQTLVNHFNYISLGTKNIFSRVISFPFKRVQKVNSIPVFVKDGKLLEIGCSHGAHLKRLKDYGWDVKGLEMDKKMAEYADSRGLSVSSGRIEDADFDANSFDAVLMSMVLEHLHDPFMNLDRIARWLKPGGQLIFSIPYMEGVEFKIFKEYSYGLQLPHHITFFNKKIIREYLKKLGYKDIKFYFQFFDRDVVVSSQFKHADTKNPLYEFIGYNKIFRYLIIKPLLLILSILGKTSRVTVHAEKC